MTSVHEHKSGFIKPGNEEYLSYYVYQGEWKPTKPIGQIGALTTSPGPAIVNLPPSTGNKGHDPTKARAPAFKFGEKDDRLLFSNSPGPAGYDTRKITNKGVDICNAPKIGEKIEGLVPFRSPGPAAYHRGDCDPYFYKQTPSYTMRPKVEPLKGFKPPAPGAYTVPDTIGYGKSPFQKSPSYSIAERLDKTGIYQPNPGPAAYQLPPTNVNRRKAPAFSMGTKEKSPSVAKTGIGSPGPMANDYHLVKFHKPATPRFSFGIRHTPFKAFQRFAAEE